MKSMKVISFGVITGIIIAATLLILFVTGAIDQDTLTGNLGRALVVIAIMVTAFMGIAAVARLNSNDDTKNN